MVPINTPLTRDAAKKLMALDAQDKEILTYEKLDEWYTAWGGRCYVSFSGGKDSTVLAYLAARYLASFRTPPWELNLVFVNTGLEYPEIQKFVNEYAAWLRGGVSPRDCQPCTPASEDEHPAGCDEVRVQHCEQRGGRLYYCRKAQPKLPTHEVFTRGG